MKTIVCMVLIILLIGQWVLGEENNGTSVASSSNREKFVEMAGRRLQDLWARYSGEQEKDSFIGRCFGVARKLKFVMPLIIFKLGVIITVLAFLTIFSLKSLGLLGLLLLINVSGAISKISAALAGKHDSKSGKPQNVHLHVHQGKDGHIFETAPGWDDKVGQSGSEEDLNNLEAYNMYYKLNRNPFLRTYRDTLS